MTLSILPAASLLAGMAAPARAQTSEVASLSVARANAPIPLDGRVTGPAWAGADSISDFRQREPVEGAAASERTVVKVMRDVAALYIAVRAYDDDIRQVHANELRRDADLSSDDHVQVLIDGFHDRRGAFVFGTNPNGAMWDAQLAGVEALNEDWNGIWNVTVTRDAAGWTALFRIPFRTLRFRPGNQVRFGFNVRRFIRGKNEEDLWRSWGRAEGLYLLLREGDLVLDVVDRSGAVDLYPYLLGRAIESEHDSAGTQTREGFFGGKAGLDVKLPLASAVTADVTANTDFAQVEADQQVINLTRFPLFFPEKREFFLESSGLFDFGTSQRVQAFYSRRIGLDTLGEPVPIVAGGRLYGRAGPWRLGGLDVQTGGAEGTNSAVLRVQHDLLARSYLGAIATLRSESRAGARSAGGVDLDFPLLIGGQNLEPKVWIAGSRTPGVPGVPLAWRVSTDFPNDLFDNFVSLYRIEAGFMPPLGFVRRSGIWETYGHINFMPRPHALGIRRLDFKLIPEWDVIADASGSLGRTKDWQTAEFEWRLLGGERQNGDRFEVNLQRLLDAPTDTFDVFHGVPIPPRRYWWSRYELQYEMAPRRPVSLRAFVNWGAFYGGRSADVQLQGTWRGGGHLIISTEVTRTAARLPAGGFTAVLVSGRIEYDFTAWTSFLGFLQYNNDDRRADFNLRFHWIPQIGDEVFLVWNSGYTTDRSAAYRFPALRSLGRPLNGALVLKVVHRLAL